MNIIFGNEIATYSHISRRLICIKPWPHHDNEPNFQACVMWSCIISRLFSRFFFYFFIFSRKVFSERRDLNKLEVLETINSNKRFESLSKKKKKKKKSQTKISFFLVRLRGRINMHSRILTFPAGKSNFLNKLLVHRPATVAIISL